MNQEIKNLEESVGVMGVEKCNQLFVEIKKELVAYEANGTMESGALPVLNNIIAKLLQSYDALSPSEKVRWNTCVWPQVENLLNDIETVIKIKPREKERFDGHASLPEHVARFVEHTRRLVNEARQTIK